MSSTRSRYLVAAGAMAAAAYRIQTLSVAGAVVLDWSAYDEIRLTLTGPVSLSMTGGTNGKKVMLRLAQNAVGGHAVTLPNSVRYNTDVPDYVATPTVNLFDRLGFLCDADESAYDLVAVAKGYTVRSTVPAPAPAPSYRHWRVLCSVDNGANLLSFQEIELFNASGTQLFVPTPATNTSASSNYSSTGYEAAKAFDGSQDPSNGAWAANTATMPQWIAWDMTAQVQIKTIKLYPVNYPPVLPGRSPKNFVIQGRNLLSDAWTDLVSFTNVTAWTAGTAFVIDTTPAPAPAPSSATTIIAKHIRLSCLASQGSPYYRVGEVEVSKISGGLNLCTGGTAYGDYNYYPAANAFDGNLNTDLSPSSVPWAGQPGSPRILQYNFAAPVEMGFVRIYNGGGEVGAASGQDLKDFDIQTSNDDITWTTRVQVRNRANSPSLISEYALMA